MKVGKMAIYSAIFGILLTLFSSFVVIKTTYLFPGTTTNSSAFTLGGCDAKEYATGFPVAYNQIDFGTCVESNPQIDYVRIFLDFVFYYVISYIILALAVRRYPQRTERVAFWLAITGGCTLIVVFLGIFLLLLITRGTI